MPRAYEVDQLVQFPNSLYRYMCRNWSGIIASLGADGGSCPPGDDKRIDRIYLGIPMLHDIGCALYNAHGSFSAREQPVRLIDALTRFGFFEDAEIEKVPFWRIEPYVKVGDQPSAQSGVYVTVYRRPRGGGGCKALFVIQNGSEAEVELPLRIMDPRRILGGANTLRAADARQDGTGPAVVVAWAAERAKRDADVAVLRDIESGDVVVPVPAQPETYGPVNVPYHDFRVLYAESKGGVR